MGFLPAVHPADDYTPASISARIHHIEIELPSTAIDALRQHPRRPVAGVLRIDGAPPMTSVSLHLKGATGSFRPIDDQPSLTVQFDRFQPGGRGLGVTRLHLNNSVEDPSHLHEWVGTELFRRAGLPAVAVGHAVVMLNRRPLGLYVVCEGFEPEFIQRHFPEADGRVFEPESGADVDGPMKVHGPGDATGLAPLRAVLAREKLESRWAALDGWLDRERFITFAVVEVFAGHRDGYVLARNNYRFAPEDRTGRLVFLPHGMDQLFDQAQIPWRPQAAGGIAQALFADPDGLNRYEARFRELLPILSQTAELEPLIDEVNVRIESVLSPAERAAQRQATTEFKQRIRARTTELARQLAIPKAAEPDLSNGRTRLVGWEAIDPPDGGRMEVTGTREKSLHVVAGPTTAASWRTIVRLGSGRYRFSGRVRTENVAPLGFGKNQGAALRVIGQELRSPGLLGTDPGTDVGVDFAVDQGPVEVSLACELRASKGEAWFDLGSLGLERIKKP